MSLPFEMEPVAPYYRTDHLDAPASARLTGTTISWPRRRLNLTTHAAKLIHHAASL